MSSSEEAAASPSGTAVLRSAKDLFDMVFQKQLYRSSKEARYWLQAARRDT